MRRGSAFEFDALAAAASDYDEVIDELLSVKGESRVEVEDYTVVNSKAALRGQKTKSMAKGPNKQGGNATRFVAAAAAQLDELDGEKDEDKDTPPCSLSFSDKKNKASKKGTGRIFGASALDAVAIVNANEDDHSEVVEEGDSSKLEDDQDDDMLANCEEEVAETSKKRKKMKKKKSVGRTSQEEEDLDKILEELGEKETVIPALFDATAGEKEESVESAAAKKKKKKKEKEKEKKAAALASADTREESRGETKTLETAADDTEKKDGKKGKAAANKKEKAVRKHVRDMQEILARRKEAEERNKREEEERLRKEEDELRRQQELERRAQEVKRRKKEKLLKKKQEGKLLTRKQKEEACRREAMRNQILLHANAGGSLPLPKQLDKDKEGGAPAKRPLYIIKKKSKTAASASANPNEINHVQAKEAQHEEQVDSVVEDEKVEEKSEVADITTVENGTTTEDEDEDEDEWDRKSWDDVNLNIKGTVSEEEEEEAEADSEPVFFTLTAPAVTSKQTAESNKQLAIKSQGKKPDLSAKKENNNYALPLPKQMQSSENDHIVLRSPICCVMGHVDSGKTKLLDCIRGTNVQGGEAGRGITQQIGATYFPAQNIRERTKDLHAKLKLKVPGLVVIDTPGHQSFTNLRARGSALCDIAILVVDIMDGLKPQTVESLNLLKMTNTEFIIALNKVDKLYGWKACRNAPIVKSIKEQSQDVQNEFNTRLTQVITQLKEQGLNSELYYKNEEMGETFSIVPTSAYTGEGIPDLLLLLVQWTQKTMVEKLTFSDEVQCTVMEVKVIQGLGTTIDVVLVNGVLHEGDQIVVCGMQGPIATTIRALLTPHPMKETRVKGTYMQHKEIKAAQGIKIAAQGLEHAIAGTGLYVVVRDDDLEDVKETAKEDMESVMSRIDKSGEGVYVQASTLGSLEALLEFLKTPQVNIPVSGIGIGPVHKKDVMKASVMLEKKKTIEYATILAFDVKVTPEAQKLADGLGVKIFNADVIYHLFDRFKVYIDSIKEERKREAADEAVFPCVFKISPNFIFNKKDPIVSGVHILEGILKVGTPICIPQREFIDIGRIASIRINGNDVIVAKKGQKKVSIKIVGTNPEEQQKVYGRHFGPEDELVSHISRRSIDVLKANHKDDLTPEEWKLVRKLKIVFKIR